MTLRDAPLPRMAGHLPFMRGGRGRLDDVRADQIAVFGAAIAERLDDTSLGPLALRETSSYFGSHFSSTMKAAIDIDRRRTLDAAVLAGSLIDLGDIDPAAAEKPEDAVAVLGAEIARRGARPCLLGGSARLAHALARGLSHERGQEVPLAGLRDYRGPEARGAPSLAVIDIADFASVWHGASLRAGFHGLSLSQARERLRAIGGSDVAGVALVGLDPARQGLSIVKIGQRLLVTALLDLLYARLDRPSHQETQRA